MISKFVSLLFAFLGIGTDIITVTEGTAGNVGSTAAELITYMAARMLEVAELNTILDQFADKQPLPANSSKTIRFTRMEKLGVSTVPTQLSEGIPPAAQGLTINLVEATIEQYGALIRLSDLAELTARHNIVEKAIYILGLNAAEVYDQLVYNVLDAATNVYRPNSRTADTALIGTDRISYVDLVALDALLMDQGARPYEAGEYVFVTPPQVYAGLLTDPDFKAAAQFAAPEKIWRGEVATLGGFRVVRTNAPAFAATSQAGSGQSDKVYSSFGLGRFAYQLTDLQSLEVSVVPPGGHTDPLKQNRLIGYKFSTKSKISNQNWLRRIRCAGANSVTNP